MWLLDMDKNSSFPYTINQEAIQSWANTHLQNTLPGKDIAIKTAQPILLYAIMKPITESQIFEVLCPLHHIVLAPAPAKLAWNHLLY